jgi:hypothetical protein
LNVALLEERCKSKKDFYSAKEFFKKISFSFFLSATPDFTAFSESFISL